MTAITAAMDKSTAVAGAIESLLRVWATSREDVPAVLDADFSIEKVKSSAVAEKQYISSLLPTLQSLQERDSIDLALILRHLVEQKLVDADFVAGQLFSVNIACSATRKKLRGGAATKKQKK